MKNVDGPIREYLDEVQRCSLEAQKATRFSFLLAELFPSLRSLAEQYSRGRERTIRILDAGTPRRGHVDAYYRNAVIEFERALDRTLSEAVEQLRVYTAALWNEKKKRSSLVCVATDGVVWRTYHPRTPVPEGTRLEPSDVDLVEAEKVDLRHTLPGDFYFWLDRLLLRENDLEPSSEAIQQDFGSRSAAFIDATEALRRAFGMVREEPEVATAFREWRQYLTFVYGQDTATENLFLRHTYLSLFARFLVWATVVRPAREPREVGAGLDRILDGRAFEEAGFQNLQEGGFFNWIEHEPAARLLRPVWLRLLSQLATYALDEIDEDVLKGVYQDLVDPETRHDLGEYYTPDWLAARIVSELLGEWTGPDVPTILDPACGSGTFLRIAIRELDSRLDRKLTGERLETITSRVFGFDIHPLAVQISRATYVLALRGLLRAHRQPVEIPVYLADSLFVPRPLQPLELPFAGPSIPLQFADKTAEVPAAVLDDPGLFNPLVAEADSLAGGLARGGEETLEGFKASLRRRLPSAAGLYNFDQVAEAFYGVAERLAELRREKHDTIWAFVLRNMYRPALLRNRFDFVVGNPPWLSYRYISDPNYQKRVADLADRYLLAAKGKLRTHLELAAIFLLWATESYLKDGGRLCFVMPRSLFNGDQHDALRRQKYDAPCRLDRVWDLRAVEPLFKVPACVVFATRSKIEKPAERLPCRFLRGRLPRKNASAVEADAALEIREGGLFLNFLGERSCWHAKRLFPEPKPPSAYLKRFRQGATIVPRNFYFVTPAREDFPEGADVFVRTDEQQRKEAKPPYRDEVLEGTVEGRFLRRAMLSKHVLPFCCLPPAWVVLPVEPDRDEYRVVGVSDLKRAGCRRMAKWMGEVETRWRRLRGTKAARLTALQRLDFQRGLSSQTPRAEHLVLYNASGTHLAAALLETKGQPPVIDAKCYWCAVPDSAEGHYLCGVLNADTTNGAIKPFQSVGLKGERDLHTKVLTLPIPTFDSTNDLHRRVSKLASLSSEKAARFAASGEGTRSIGKFRSDLRSHLAVERKELDRMVQELLGVPGLLRFKSTPT